MSDIKSKKVYNIFYIMAPPQPRSTLFPYTTLFRSQSAAPPPEIPPDLAARAREQVRRYLGRSEEHTSELQSPYDLVCRLLLEKKKKRTNLNRRATPHGARTKESPAQRAATTQEIRR